jgi:hypothetical protein
MLKFADTLNVKVLVVIMGENLLCRGEGCKH